MENSSKQSEMSHNLVRWKLRESSAVWRSIHTGWNGQCYTSRVVTGPECTDADCRWAREGGSVLGLQKCVFFNVTPNPFVQSYHTESALWSYREQQWGISRTFSVIAWLDSELRVLPPPARAHTQTHGLTRAHTHIWGEGMGTVGNLTGTVQFVVLKLIFKPNFLWGLNVARLLCCLHDLKRRSRFVLHQLRKILVAFVS